VPLAGDRGGGDFLPDVFSDARQYIEAAFGADPTADPDTWTWTYIGGPSTVQWNPGVDITIGERDEALSITPANFTCKIRNDQPNGGDFSIDNPLGKYWPYVREDVPIRARLDLGLGPSVRFQGYAEGWTPTWIGNDDDGTRISAVQLVAKGAVYRLKQGTSAPRSPMWRYNMLSYRFPRDTNAGWYSGEDQGYHILPSHYWALEEGSAAVRGENAVQPAYPLTAAAGHLPRFSADTALLCTRAMPSFNDGASLTVQFPMITATGGTEEFGIFSAPPTIRCQFLVRLSESTITALKDSLGTLADGLKARLLSLEVSSTTLARATVFLDNDPTDGLLMYLETKNHSDTTMQTIGGLVGLPFEQGVYVTLDILRSGTDIIVSMGHLPLVMDPDTAAADYPFTAVYQATTGMTSSTLYGVHGLTVSGTENLNGGCVGQITLYGDNDDQSFGDRYPRALLGRSGDTVATRLYRLGVEQNVAIDVIGDADLIMGAQSVNGFLDLVIEAWKVDSGILLDGLNSGLTYITRTQATSQAAGLTLDAAGGGDIVDLEIVHNAQSRVNTFTARNNAGAESTFTQTDGALGTDTVGVYESADEIRAGLPSDLYQVAAWRVAQGTVGGLRYPRVEVEFAKSGMTAKAQQWIDSLPFSRLDVLGLGSNGTDLRFLIRGWRERWNSKQLRVSMNLSPYDAWTVAILAADVGDSGDFLLWLAEDDGASTLAAAAAAGATTLTVQTTGNGPVWTTVADDISGLNILINGIKIPVTNITGATSPQTFTVTGSAVLKALPAGSAVAVFNPPILGL
jgi:hypothetical protein